MEKLKKENIDVQEKLSELDSTCENDDIVDALMSTLINIKLSNDVNENEIKEKFEEIVRLLSKMNHSKYYYF
jgi:hypothetical protein